MVIGGVQHGRHQSPDQMSVQVSATMPNVRIITDSNAYLPADLLERYPIEVLPHRLKIGGSFFEEDSDFGVDEFFEKVGEARRSNPQAAPEVQAPPVNAFLEQFQNGG